MNSFDFVYVHNYMKNVGWGWGLDNIVPSIGDIKVAAEELLNGCARSDNQPWTTGGFIAEYKDDRLSLDFQFKDADVNFMGMTAKQLVEEYRA